MESDDESSQSENTKRSFSKLSPVKSPKPKKYILSVISTPVKKNSPKNPKAGTSTIARYVENSEYKGLVNKLIRRKGFRRASEKATGRIIRQELQACGRNSSKLLMCKSFSLKTLSDFNWTQCITELSKYAPTTIDMLVHMMTKPGRHNEEIGIDDVNLSTLGLILAIILHYRQPKKFKLVQDMITTQLYKSGSPNKLIRSFNKLHLSAGPDTAKQLMDRIIQEYKTTILDHKKKMEESLSGRPKRRCRLLGTEKKEIDPNHSYTFCWDNTQMEIKARDQTQDKNVWQKLWALCYAAMNRVRTDHLPDNPQMCLQASAIPLETYLPTNPDHVEDVKDWMFFQIKQTLLLHLQAFTCIKQDPNIEHEFWEEVTEKSIVINLGVVDENPSTTDGVIGILDYLTTFVPQYPDGRPHTIITHCDGGAFEKMVAAKRIRAPDRGPMRKLKGLEPSAQEFHKRMLMVQDIMNVYFKGSSQTDRGTLSNIKSVMGQHSVKAKVVDAFNHVETMFDMVCDGLICIFAMTLMGMGSREEPLEAEDREQHLDDTIKTMIERIWMQPTPQDIREVIHALVPPKKDFHDICCGEEVTGEIVTCSNPGCPSGGYFHAQCIELINNEVPSDEDDWWCSPICHTWSKFCKCKQHVEDSIMVECEHGKRCPNRWFHLSCVGLIDAPSSKEKWYCPQCKLEDPDDGVFSYSTGLLWVLLNDRLRRYAIRTGNGRMLLEFWRDDCFAFWNNNHYKYLMLMHRMVAGVNGWLTEREAADLTWNRTVNIRGGPCHNVAMDKMNEFLNCEFKANLKTSKGKYTDAQIDRSSYMAGGVSRGLDAAFAVNVAGSVANKTSYGKKHHASVRQFIEEYQGDKLFDEIPGRYHRHFPHFNARRIHQVIKKPVDLKDRLMAYSSKLDRGRLASGSVASRANKI